MTIRGVLMARLAHAAAWCIGVIIVMIYGGRLALSRTQQHLLAAHLFPAASTHSISRK